MKPFIRVWLPVVSICVAFVSPVLGADRVKTANGIVESTVAPVEGVRGFKGLPFAQPPVGDLRWREPQPVKNWDGVRNADTFGPTCMRQAVAERGLLFLGDGMSERLPGPERLDAGEIGPRELPVLVSLRRRLPERRRLRAAVRRRVAVAPGHRRDIAELTARTSSASSCATELTRIAPQGVGHLRPARPGGRAEVGAAEHRGVRRRSDAVTIAGEFRRISNLGGDAALMASPLSKA